MSAEVDLTDIRILELPTIDLSRGVDLGLDVRILEFQTCGEGMLIEENCSPSGRGVSP